MLYVFFNCIQHLCNDHIKFDTLNIIPYISVMGKRIIHSGIDTYKFSNSISGDVGMLIEKNGEELGVYPHFEYGDSLDGDYLIELALEFGCED